jgi:hypothetical protein
VVLGDDTRWATPTFSGLVTANAGLTVTAGTTSVQALTAAGLGTFNGGLVVNGNAHVTGTLVVDTTAAFTGLGTFSAGATVHGVTTLGTTNSLTVSDAGFLEMNGNGEVQGYLIVRGLFTPLGEVDIGTNLVVNGTTNLYGATAVPNAVSSSTKLTIGTFSAGIWSPSDNNLTIGTAFLTTAGINTTGNSTFLGTNIFNGGMTTLGASTPMTVSSAGAMAVTNTATAATFAGGITITAGGLSVTGTTALPTGATIGGVAITGAASTITVPNLAVSGTTALTGNVTGAVNFTGALTSTGSTALPTGTTIGGVAVTGSGSTISVPGLATVTNGDIVINGTGTLTLGSGGLASALPVSSGGTGATTVTAARTNLAIIDSTNFAHDTIVANGGGLPTAMHVHLLNPNAGTPQVFTLPSALSSAVPDGEIYYVCNISPAFMTVLTGDGGAGINIDGVASNVTGVVLPPMAAGGAAFGFMFNSATGWVRMFGPPKPLKYVVPTTGTALNGPYGAPTTVLTLTVPAYTLQVGDVFDFMASGYVTWSSGTATLNALVQAVSTGTGTTTGTLLAQPSGITSNATPHTWVIRGRIIVLALGGGTTGSALVTSEMAVNLLADTVVQSSAVAEISGGGENILMDTTSAVTFNVVWNYSGGVLSVGKLTSGYIRRQ